MFNINDTNGDSKFLERYQKRLLKEFPRETLYGIEFGVAYGGGMEQICKLWRNRGIVVGYDTFTEHPKHLASYDIEETIMDGWYNEHGKENLLSKEHIQKELTDGGIFNFILVKEEVTSKSVLDVPFRFHYALLDFDIAVCMNDAYNMVRDRMIPGGYLCVHDIIPEDHLPKTHDWWFNTILPKDKLTLVANGKYLGVYRV